MNPPAFFQWCYETALGESIRDSVWIFPAIEAVHLLGLAFTIGAVLIVDLRLLGVGLTRQPASLLAADAEPWLLGSLGVMFASGIPLFMSEATKAYFSIPFWVKMSSLFLVLIFTFTVRRRVTQGNLAEERPGLGRWIAITSLTLWFGVAWGGRWIGFS